MIDISHALTVQGWMGELELMYLAEIASKSNWIVEVGSWKGRSTCAFAANVGKMVYAVDTWRGSPEHQDELAGKDEDWLMREFLTNVGPLKEKISLVRMASTTAAAYIGGDFQFDVIFLDANHSYESVKADILAWTPLLAEEGILCGHDYTEHWPGVMQAVQECVPKFRIVESTSIWTTEAA